MILLLLQLVICSGLSLWFGLTSAIVSPVWRIGASLLVFGGLFIAVLIVYLSILIIVIIVFADGNPKNMLRHNFLTLYSDYVYVRLIGLKLSIEGKENCPTHSRFVVFSNHIEHSDPLYIRMAFPHFPLAFIAKETLFHNFLVKKVIAFVGTVPISRESGRQAMQGILDGIAVLESGRPIVVFPEGTRSYKNEMISFKPGSFKLATKPMAEIIPVCLYDMHELYKKGRRWPAKAYVKLLKPIKPEEYQELDTIRLSELVQSRIQEAIREYDLRFHRIEQ